ncbi:MAG: 16S rRNA (adenine(1518)-N(6)/adenine(1519)-N(6))-dimethyltransferase RsmA [Candidatus Aminicenantales bacterium]
MYFWYSDPGFASSIFMNAKKRRRKALGQHFLTKKSVLERILRVIDPQPGEWIIEIGAGKGALSIPLARKGARVVAIEKDRLLLSSLKDRHVPNLVLKEGNVLALRFSDLVPEKRVKIVGNLPYAISSPLLFKVLEEKDIVLACVFLLQKEVAERLCAEPGSKKYAPLSILFHNEFHTRLHLIVPPSAFSPPPKVESALVSLEKRAEPLEIIPDETKFHEFLRGSFQNRRKKLINNLRMAGFPEPQIRHAFRKAGIPDHWRGEQVSLSEFVKLYSTLYGLSGPSPP